MTDNKAWKSIQAHFKRYRVKPKDISPKDWFLAGYHMGATHNNAAYFEKLLMSWDRIAEEKPPKKLRPKRLQLKP